MSQAFGHNSWIGVGAESTYGTAVSPTTFIEIQKESLKGKHSALSKPNLRSPSARYYVKSKKDVGGAVDFQLPFEGAELLLKHAFGAVTTTTPEVGRKQHVFSLASNLPTGLTFHINRDALNIGGSSAFQYVGCQINKLTIKQSLEDMLMCTADVLGRDWSNVAVATPTFPTFKQIDWEMPIFQIDSVDVPISDLELTIENALASDRYKLGSRVRKGLGRNGPRKVSGKFNLEFDSLTFYNYYKNLTAGVYNITWTGGTLVTGNYKFQLDLPKSLCTDGEPSAENAGPIILPIAFDAFASAADNDEVVLTLHNTVASV